MSDKVQFPIVENGYDVTATDTYIEMLQSEYNRVCEWGTALEKRVTELENSEVSSQEVENLRVQNRSLYNNCVIFAKYIKSLEKLKNEQSKFIDAELSVAENRKKALEQEMAAIEEKKRLIEESNNSAINKADEILRNANSCAEKTVSRANEEAMQIIQNAKNRADDLLKEWMDKMSVICSEIDNVVPKSE